MKNLLRIAALSLLVPLLGLAACSETATTPTTAPAPALHNRGGGSPDLSVLARFHQRPAITIAWAKQWIGPEGGRLEFYGFAIHVPAGAVSKRTQFSIRLPVDPNGSERVVAEFGPHGAVFARPVTIELPLRGTTLESDEAATIVWWNDGWVDMEAVPTPDAARLRATTTHFSTYGTADAQGVLTQGG